MKRQLCSLALSTLFGVGVVIAAPLAQDQAPPPQNNADGQRDGGRRQPPDPNRQVQMLTKRLKLTSDQQNKILPILTNRNQQMENLRSDSSLSQDDRRAKMRSIREDSETQIKAVLNDKQKQAYDQMQQEMRERQQQRRDQQ